MNILQELARNRAVSGLNRERGEAAVSPPAETGGPRPPWCPFHGGAKTQSWAVPPVAGHTGAVAAPGVSGAAVSGEWKRAESEAPPPPLETRRYSLNRPPDRALSLPAVGETGETAPMAEVAGVRFPRGEGGDAAPAAGESPVEQLLRHLETEARRRPQPLSEEECP